MAPAAQGSGHGHRLPRVGPRLVGDPAGGRAGGGSGGGSGGGVLGGRGRLGNRGCRSLRLVAGESCDRPGDSRSFGGVDRFRRVLVRSG
ncbi:MAG: hypothetical protein FJ257_04195 [Phycisphaerae bacterium]|nr:hypothetical protein [Phycisphaerae bacterium]